MGLHKCADCRLSIDPEMRGVCPRCRSLRGLAITWYKCVMCKAPFAEGKPHPKCLDKLGVARGVAPSYWGARKVVRKSARQERRKA